MFGAISNKLQELLLQVYGFIFIPKPPNLLGDRDVENAFISANIPNKKGQALDFGSGNSNLSLMATLRGYNVTATDLTPNHFNFEYKNIKFFVSDILKKSIKKNYFDLIINCSSIEHVGLSGRYGVNEQENDGDLKAMGILYEGLKKDGIMILTIPVGIDSVIPTRHRVYGKIRLPKLINSYKVVEEMYWTKNSRNIWVVSPKSKALSTRPSDHFYSLGCLVLKRK